MDGTRRFIARTPQQAKRPRLVGRDLETEMADVLWLRARVIAAQRKAGKKQARIARVAWKR